MPQRFLRPAIRNSQRWNSVTRFEQVLYIGILTLVDDFGRYDGRASVIWGECFAVWNELNPADQVSLEQTGSGLQQLAAKNLIDLYLVGGKKVLQVTQWQERVRAGCKERWPENPDLQQLAAKRSKNLPPPPSPPPSPPPNANTPKRMVAPSPEFKAFTDGWCANFHASHGFSYQFNGSRDGKAVKELLSMGILRLDLLEIAKSAWKESAENPRDHFYCKQAVTIHGFRNHFNQIRNELNGASPKTVHNHI